MSLSDPSIDSLKWTELIIELEEELTGTIPASAVAELESVADLIRYLRNQR